MATTLVRGGGCGGCVNESDISPVKRQLLLTQPADRRLDACARTNASLGGTRRSCYQCCHGHFDCVALNV